MLLFEQVEGPLKIQDWFIYGLYGFERGVLAGIGIGTSRNFQVGDYHSEGTLPGYHCLSMESDRLIKIEKRVGVALIIVNCVRLAFWLPTVASVRVTGDLLALFGGILYFRALYIERKTNLKPYANVFPAYSEVGTELCVTAGRGG